MKILLVAINAKYIHSNLAIYSLKAYCQKYREKVRLMEYTINNRTEDILRGIYMEKPEVVAFSSYIWNISHVNQIGRELKKVLPGVSIWAGGPEVSYNGREQLETKPWLSGIMMGEGEETFSQLTEYWMGEIPLTEIKGIVYRGETEEIIENEARPPLDISTIPFPYEKTDDFKNRIIYYETSRGCPYSCSYCLSSIEKGIRFRDLELVKKEVKFFLEAKVPQVKFIDRTFNCNHHHAMEIWRFIYENDNGITNFHFEISADLLSAEEIQLIRKFRPGLIQFEIGVQSIHPQAIKAIHRTMDLKKLSHAVRKVKEGGNIHQHLDLIAGLPYEDYASFQRSFDYVCGLKPDQLQLGFLKVLKGSHMFLDSEEFNLVYTHTPPYEVLSTKWLTFDDVLILKKVEEMVEIYYNSGQFSNGIAFLEHFYQSPFALYRDLGNFYEEKALDEVSHSRISRYEILLGFYREHWNRESETFEEILLFDLYLRENLKSRPAFGVDPLVYKKEIQDFFREEERLHALLPEYRDFNGKQISRMVHMEHFHVDILKTVETGKRQEGNYNILFDYRERNPLNHQAKVIYIERS